MTGGRTLVALDAYQIVPYLLDHGLLEHSGLLDGTVRIEGRNRRHANFVVRTEAGGLLVKQALTPIAASTLDHEAIMLGHVAALLPTGCVPRLRLHDPSRHLLVTDLLEEAASLSSMAGDEHAPVHLADVAAVLAAVHKLPFDHPVVARPAGLSLHRPSIDLIRQSSRANVQLLGVIQAEDALCALLDALWTGWSARGLIHADAKLDNVLVGKGQQFGAAPVMLVDWELAGLGDPRWDTGSVLGDVLYHWMLRFGQRRTGPGNEGWLSPALHAVTGGSGIGSEPPFDDALRHAAGRLVQTAYEIGQRRTELSAEMIGAVQLAANIAIRRDEVTALLITAAEVDAV